MNPADLLEEPAVLVCGGVGGLTVTGMSHFASDYQQSKFCRLLSDYQRNC